MPQPRRNVAYTFPVSLVDASTGQFRANPTLASGDVKVSTDGSALTNITSLPTVTPAASRIVVVSLSASEMNGGNIVVQFVDQTGPAEWDELIATVETETARIVSATVSGVTSSSVFAASDLPSGLDNDGLNGRIVIFEGNTTAELRDQASDITDYVGSTKQITVTPLTRAPASGDRFNIV